MYHFEHIVAYYQTLVFGKGKHDAAKQLDTQRFRWRTYLVFSRGDPTWVGSGVSIALIDMRAY